MVLVNNVRDSVESAALPVLKYMIKIPRQGQGRGEFDGEDLVETGEELAKGAVRR